MKRILLLITAALFMGAAFFLSQQAEAGSCCGGGAATALVLPRDGQAMIETSFDIEKYDGFWTVDGKYQPDQPGTNLRQYRLNMGYALRIAPRWQASASIPYVWNVNKYQDGRTTRVSDFGDSQFSLWYEAVDTAMCRLGWDSLSPADFVPAATFGLSLTVPTGVSSYDGVASDDITGRGFYRLDGNVLLDKTIYPLSASLFLSYGKHLERPVNREIDYVEPYHKKLGDRAVGTFSMSYVTHVDLNDSRHTITYTAALSEVWEGKGTYNGNRDPTTGLEKTSIAGTVAWSTLDRVWTVKTTWNHSIKSDNWGRNTPASDIYSIGVSYVFK